MRIIFKGECAWGLSCFNCGEYVDEVVLANRGLEQRTFWRRKVESKMGKPSRAEKILQEYEPAAIRWNL